MPRLEPIDTLPDEPLALPIRGRDGIMRDYEIQPVDAETWYKFSALGQVFEAARLGYKAHEADEKIVNELQEQLGAIGLQRVALGAEVVEQLLADGVSSADFRRAYTAALVWHTSGGDTARAAEVWSAGKARPSTPTPEPTEQTATTSTSTAAATTTKKRASGSGTNSRPRSKPATTSRGERSGPATT